MNTEDGSYLLTMKLSLRKASYIGVAFLMVYIVIALLLENQPIISAVFGYVMITLLYIAVTFSLFLAARASNTYENGNKTAWSVLAFAALTSVVASILWAVDTIYYHQNPSNSFANLLYLMFYPLFLIGILIFPSSNITIRQRIKRYLDIVIIMFSLLLLLWTFLIAPAVLNFNGNFTSILFNLTYVFGGFLLLFAMLDMIFNRIWKGNYSHFLILFGGIFVLFVSSSVFAYQNLHGTYVQGGPADIGWLVGYLLIGLAGVSQFNHHRIELGSLKEKYFTWNTKYTLTPYLALAGVSIAYIALVWAYNTHNSNLNFLEFGVGVLIILVVLRQFVSISENKNLYWRAKEEIALREEISISLKESEAAYRTIFENTGTATVIIEEDSLISLANTEFEKLSGFSKEEVEGLKTWTEFVIAEDLAGMLEKNDTRLQRSDSEPKNYEFRLKDRSGNIKHIYVVAAMIPGTRDSLISLLDVTKSKNYEDEIKKSLEEKETLLKEIHHRVKNNLTVISSLLNLQSRYIKDKDDLIMFMESQSRAKSMALIHQRLYDSSDLKSIDFGDYIRTLATDMFNTYVQNPKQIRLNLFVDDILLDVNTAIPLGLILNELLTNSMKYAFPFSHDLESVDEEGNINVKLYKNKTGYTLTVEDDGVGFPEDVNLENLDSLGFQLINSLTNQIDGKINLKTGNGTSFSVDFKEDRFKK